ELGDRGDAVVGRLNGVKGGRHRVEQVAQVAGAVRQALCSEVVDRVIESAVDPLAGGKLGLGRRDELGRLLQLQKVRPHAGGENDISHSKAPFWSNSPTREDDT